MICVFIILITILAGYYYLKLAYPVLAASSENAAYSKVNNIVTTEIKNIMEKYKYEDLIKVEKNNNGEISLLKSNTVAINGLIAELTHEIQKKIDEEVRTIVFINMGTISGISKLQFVGPKFEIELETAGDTTVNLVSEFETTGINQTIHKIYADIDTYIKIFTPFGNFERDMKSKVLLIEAIIVGEVPSSYYNLEGIESSNLSNLIK